MFFACANYFDHDDKCALNVSFKMVVIKTDCCKLHCVSSAVKTRVSLHFCKQISENTCKIGRKLVT